MKVIDVESTGLNNNSMPIQLAWTDNDGEYISVFIKYEDSLIERIWEEEAEGVHGISKEFLSKYGISPESACKVINDSVSGKELYSDAIDMDSKWMLGLFEFSECDMEFSLNDIFSEHISTKNRDGALFNFEEDKAAMFKSLGIEPHMASHDVWVNSKILNKK